MRLSVNIDHIATIREARKAREPEPVAAAILAELGGAQGITVHLRGDRRHIQERDLHLLREVVSTKLNVEMAATDEMNRIAAELKPDQVTLVPERPQELTTEGGLDTIRNADAVKISIDRLKGARIRVSLFIDPLVAQVRNARKLEADAIELNTGAYAAATSAHRDRCVHDIAEAAALGAQQGLEVLGGHGLTYVNVGPIVRIREIVELNIGHSIVARSALVGMERAVREMVDILRRARQGET